jgi:hypothetical protein
MIETAPFSMLTAELTEFGRCVADRRPFPTVELFCISRIRRWA